MIIACPACATRYAVPDSALGVDGRTVRCAKCRNSWFQDGPEIKLPPRKTAPAAAPAPPPAPPPAIPEPPSEDVHEGKPKPTDEGTFAAPEEAPSPPVPEVAEDKTLSGDDDEAASVSPTFYDDSTETEYSQFDHEPPFRARRNPLKLWTYAAAIFAAIALGTVVAVSYWGLPDWVPVSRPTFGLGQTDLVLDFPADQQDRRQLPNGTEFFGASGTVTNVGRETRTLPPILIVLRDGRERIVYSWEVAPPKRSLAPGESVTINEAVTDVPKAAKFAEIGWKPS